MRWTTAALLLAFASPTLCADDVMKSIGVQRGLVVCDSADLALRLAKESRLIVYFQSSNADEVTQTRKAAQKAGLLGSRLYIERGKPSRIHLASNLADAVVLSNDSTLSVKEAMRVLRPQGKLIGKKVTTKPNQVGNSDWSHPYHGPDNNPLSQDRNAKGPFLTKFLAEPYYGPMPEVSVTSGGRMFKAFGHISFKEREWAMLSKLIALNAYNGIKLWERDLTPGFMIHRNTMIATHDTLYLADNESCKLIEAATGKVRDEIKIAGTPGWKWMSIQDGILYALVGKKDKIDTVLKGNRKHSGWPWNGLGKIYAAKQYPWGFGRTLFAMDLKTRKFLWKKQTDEDIDSRALCMKSGRMFVYSHQKYLMAINPKNGEKIWKTTDSKVLAAIGEHDKAQTWRRGYSSQTYAKCSDRAIYFAGPQRRKVVAVSAKNGELLWTMFDGNYQLVIRDDAVYAMGKTSRSKKLDPLTGRVLANLDCLRGNCTRATGTIDSIFARGDQHGGTLRLHLDGDKPHRIPAMRPACQDGVIIANGQLYWGPWMCDCNHSLVGIVSLTSAGKYEFEQSAKESQRLEQSSTTEAAAFSINEKDWPTYRANNLRSAHTSLAVSEKPRLLWTHQAEQTIQPTAPITAGGLIFVGGSDGIVRAIDAKSGKTRWNAYTGGHIQYPPAIGKGRAYVGSGDGWVYCLEAATGKQLWRFRAAPVERKIPVYGRLLSTWPVASGVLVEDGVVYVGAGIASHDGTHIYALDAITGKIKWQNNKSGRLMGGETVAGVSVQGHMLLSKGTLYMAGGNVVSPAKYDPRTGKCLSTLKNEWQKAPRGSELFVTAGKIRVIDQMMYSPRDYIPSRYYASYMLQAKAGEVIIQGTEQAMMRVETTTSGKYKTIWKTQPFIETSAVVVVKNGVLAVGRTKGEDRKPKPESKLMLLSLETGKPIWTQTLPVRPASWGLAVDRAGRVVVTLSDGRALCYGE